jgi:signal transduction histidine kinase
LCAYLFEEEYTNFLLLASVLLPMILAPVTVYIFVQLVKHLSSVQKYLKDEIEKNRKKDILLFEQSRFVLMREMMANISHQWKQPLNTINLAVISARTSDTDVKNMGIYFDIIEDNVRYLADTIDVFMPYFDKKGSLDLKKIGDILKEIDSILSWQMQINNINFIVENECEGLKLNASITQVLLNFLSNSKDALVSGGIENREILLKISPKDETIEISCCDNGLGIKPEIKENIFDAYFTTKEKSKGTGIGLYMSKEIIEKVFDGAIDVYSIGELDDLKYNTCFVLNIPFSDNCLIRELV